MWFRNLTLYTFEAIPDTERLAAALATRRYAPCTSVEREASGFVPPHGDDAAPLVFEGDQNLRIAVCIENKVLPAQTVRDALAVRCAEVEQNQGFKPGRKQRAEIREDVTDTLLSQAFSVRKTVHAWF